ASKDLSPDAKEKAEKLVKHGAPIHVESHLGVPNFLFANSSSAQDANQDKGQKGGRGEEESAARRHIARFAPLYHLDDFDAAIGSSSLEWRESRDEFDFFTLSTQTESGINLHMAEPSRVKKVMFDLPEGLEPAYYLELNVSTAGSTDSDFYNYVISAVDGKL